MNQKHRIIYHLTWNHCNINSIHQEYLKYERTFTVITLFKIMSDSTSLWCSLKLAQPQKHFPQTFSLTHKNSETYNTNIGFSNIMPIFMACDKSISSRAALDYYYWRKFNLLLWIFQIRKPLAITFHLWKNTRKMLKRILDFYRILKIWKFAKQIKENWLLMELSPPKDV